MDYTVLLDIGGIYWSLQSLILLNLCSRKRDERLRRVYEAKIKEEQREEEKKKKIEQKMAQIDEKNDKVSK